MQTVLNMSSMPVQNSDVWSIGVIAYMLVVGYAPFSAKPNEVRYVVT